MSWELGFRLSYFGLWYQNMVLRTQSIFLGGLLNVEFYINCIFYRANICTDIVKTIVVVRKQAWIFRPNSTGWINQDTLSSSPCDRVLRNSPSYSLAAALKQYLAPLSSLSYMLCWTKSQYMKLLIELYHSLSLLPWQTFKNSFQ